MPTQPLLELKSHKAKQTSAQVSQDRFSLCNKSEDAVLLRFEEMEHLSSNGSSNAD